MTSFNHCKICDAILTTDEYKTGVDKVCSKCIERGDLAEEYALLKNQFNKKILNKVMPSEPIPLKAFGLIALALVSGLYFYPIIRQAREFNYCIDMVRKSPAFKSGVKRSPEIAYIYCRTGEI
tara:strand:- start:193 stop:561 length:369 start_codon:yes stop_codon:yes gene_type:complete